MLPLKWKQHPGEFLILPTAGDGSCALHAIIQGFNTTYLYGRNVDGSPANRRLIVREFRNELADMLNKPISGDSTKTWYDALSRGELEKYAEATSGVEDAVDLTRKGFEKHLRSDNWLGQEIVEYVSLILSIGVFVLREDERGITRGLYSLGKENALYYDKHKIAVVIVNHANEHYSTVGRLDPDGSIKTCFPMEDPLIAEFLADSS